MAAESDKADFSALWRPIMVTKLVVAAFVVAASVSYDTAGARSFNLELLAMAK